VVQRHVLYLGEISPSQAAAWRKSVEVFDEDAGHARTLALFPEDHAAVVASGRAASPVGDATMPAAAMGRVLAGGAVVVRVAARSVLGRSSAAKPKADAMGPSLKRLWYRIG
jgi:hypothetical protein